MRSFALIRLFLFDDNFLAIDDVDSLRQVTIDGRGVSNFPSAEVEDGVFIIRP